MQLYYIRHAQSENNALWDATGSNDGRSHDPELTEMGKLQAVCLAQFLNTGDSVFADRRLDAQNLAGFSLTHLYCSLMVRAVATGCEVARILNLPLQAWEDLHEEGGIYEKDPATGARMGQPGKNRTYFEINYPGLHLEETMNPAGWWNRPFEEREQRRDRARRVIARLLERHGGTSDRVAWISHGGFYYQFLSALFGLSAPEALTGPDVPGPAYSFSFELNNVAISRIDFEGGDDPRINLVYLNRVSFLPPAMIT